MDQTGAGRHSFFRNSYGRLLNPYSGPLASESEAALNPKSSPVSPGSFHSPAKEVYTVETNLSPLPRKDTSYSDINLVNYGHGTSPNPGIDRSSTFERPKPAIVRGFWPNYYKFLPHFVGIIVTGAVVQLNVREQYWMDLKNPSTEILPGITQGGALNALQLAAKCHEIILVASLGRIVLHFAQNYLIGVRGLPLGLLTNSFLIGSGEFVFTKAFWMSVWSTKIHYWRFWAISLLGTILAMLVGPSSAIAVIPSLNWYPLVAPFQQEVLPFYIFNQSTVLWPSNVTAASLNGPNSGINCTISSTSTAYQDVCPAGGFRDTYDWAGKLLFSNSSAGTNISFPDTRGDSRRVLSTQSCGSEFDGRASGLSINTFLSGAMTAFWTYARNNFQGLGLATAQPRITFQGDLYAPKVEVMCNGYRFYNQSQIDARGPVNFPSFTPNRALPEPDFVLPYRGEMNAIDVQWVAMPNGSDNPSIGSIIRVPSTYGRTNDSSIQQGTEIHACSIYAQWVSVDVYYEPRQNDEVSVGVKHKMKNTCLTVGGSSITPKSLPPKNISIDMDYANAINQPIPFTEGPVPAIHAMLDSVTFPDTRVINQTAYTFKSPFLSASSINGTLNVTTDEVRQSHSTMISTILAGVVTDGLARIAGNGIFPYSAAMFLTNQTTTDGSIVGRFVVSSAQGGDDNSLNTTAADEGNWLRVDPIFSRYGYGYSWRDSRITQFGIIVLLIHFACAITHTLYLLYIIFIAREGLVSSWSTISELLTLAMNSTPSMKLQDTCAGVEAAKTWRQVVSVRETYAGHLEMVVGEKDKLRFPQPEVGKAYGHLDAARHISVDGLRSRQAVQRR